MPDPAHARLRLPRRSLLRRRVGIALLAALTVTVAEAAAQFQIRVGPGQQERQVVSQFDTDKDGRLNTAEREAARQALGTSGPGRGGGGFRGNRAQPTPGIRLTPSDVQHYRDAPL